MSDLAECHPLTIFLGRVADRNPRAMAGAERLGADLARRLGIAPSLLGEAKPPVAGRWDRQLDAARPDLIALASAMDRRLAHGLPIMTVMGRCAAALATLPAVARRHPDACVVWFDAHGDVNTPEATTSGYLGGLVISGACGLWNSGLGDELKLSNVVLVGARDLDPDEQALIDTKRLAHVSTGSGLVERLSRAVDGRPVYIHIDCDVLEPGLVPTEYQVPDGLSFDDLHAACLALSNQPVIGLEITEFESAWPDGTPGEAEPLIEAMMPLLAVIAGRKTAQEARSRTARAEV